jgi:hypothetical protein
MATRTIERAFELARSGECRTMPELKHRLRRERLDSVDSHLAGKLTRSQLIELMTRAPLGEAAEISLD